MLLIITNVKVKKRLNNSFFCIKKEKKIRKSRILKAFNLKFDF